MKVSPIRHFNTAMAYLYFCWKMKNLRYEKSLFFSYLSMLVFGLLSYLGFYHYIFSKTNLILPDFNDNIWQFKKLRIVVIALARYNSYHLPFLIIIFVWVRFRRLFFAFIAFLVFKLLSHKEFVYKREKRKESVKK